MTTGWSEDVGWASLCSTQPTSKGFTLIELLVVIVIIGILIGMAALSLGGDHARDQTREEALRFQALIELALQEAILNSRETGIELTDGGYRFLYLDEDQWVLIENDPILRPRQLQAGVKFNLESEQIEDPTKTTDQQDTETDTAEDQPVPSVFIFSSGEVSPFEALFSHHDGDAEFTVTGDFQGNIEVVERQQL